MRVLRTRSRNSYRLLVAGSILHPLSLGAVALLLLNDHLLKPHFPSALTGKLSDMAGMVFFPVFLHGLWEVGQHLAGRFPRRTKRSAATSTLLTAFVFAATKLSPAAGSAFAWTLGALQWPVRAALAAFHGGHATLAPVSYVVDPTDALVVPLAAVAYLILRPRPARRSALRPARRPSAGRTLPPREPSRALPRL